MMDDTSASTEARAAQALELALIGRDLEVGNTARAKLMNFAMDLMETHGFGGAYASLGDLIERPEMREAINRDNRDDTSGADVPRPVTARSMTELARAAKSGDRQALVNLNARMGLGR